MYRIYAMFTEGNLPIFIKFITSPFQILSMQLLIPPPNITASEYFTFLDIYLLCSFKNLIITVNTTQSDNIEIITSAIFISSLFLINVIIPTSCYTKFITNILLTWSIKIIAIIIKMVMLNLNFFFSVIFSLFHILQTFYPNIIPYICHFLIRIYLALNSYIKLHE